MNSQQLDTLSHISPTREKRVPLAQPIRRQWTLRNHYFSAVAIVLNVRFRLVPIDDAYNDNNVPSCNQVCSAIFAA